MLQVLTEDLKQCVQLLKMIKLLKANPIAKNFTILNRNDNLGPASDRTGFFVTAKAGQVKK